MRAAINRPMNGHWREQMCRPAPRTRRFIRLGLIAAFVLGPIWSGLQAPSVVRSLASCYNSQHDATHAYAEAVTTCYNINGLAGIWSPSSGYFTAGTAPDHVNAKSQVTTNLNFYAVEVGWWYGAMNFCGGCTQACFYGAQFNGGGYGDTCGTYTPNPPGPGPNRFHVEYAGFYGGWNHWNAYVDVSLMFTSVGQGNVANYGEVGLEEQSATFPSPNNSPAVHFYQLQFSDPVTCGSTCLRYGNWTPYSFCFTQRAAPYYEGFMAGGFPTDFWAAIGSQLSPPNPACQGQYPAPPGNSSWP